MEKEQPAVEKPPSERGSSPEKVMSRELKSLIDSAKESKIISESTQIVNKVRKSRKDVVESPQQNSEKNSGSRPNSASSMVSSSSEVSAKAIEAKRSMRSQNSEFVVKHRKFLKAVSGKPDVSSESEPENPSGGMDPLNTSKVTPPSNALEKSEKRPMTSIKVDENGRSMDPFCWHCHRDSPLVHCSLCPRSYHQRCLGGRAPAGGTAWACPECVAAMYADNTDTRSLTMQTVSQAQLCTLLKFALKRMVDINGTEPFMTPVDPEQFPDYLNYVVKPMDLSKLRENINTNTYGSTTAFQTDTKWILHNSIIFNSFQSKLTSVARSIMKACKQEMSEIETCPQCYLNANTKDCKWFIEVCDRPHILLWAKLKSFPYWPAKGMAVSNNGLVDVRFFGAHDRAWVPIRDCFLYSIRDPNINNKMKKSDILECIKEVDIHVQNIINKFGSFKHAPFKTTYLPMEEDNQLRMLIPNYNGSFSRKSNKMQESSSPSTTIVQTSLMNEKTIYTIIGIDSTHNHTTLNSNSPKMQPKVLLSYPKQHITTNDSYNKGEEGYGTEDETFETSPLRCKTPSVTEDEIDDDSKKETIQLDDSDDEPHTLATIKIVSNDHTSKRKRSSIHSDSSNTNDTAELFTTKKPRNLLNEIDETIDVTNEKPESSKIMLEYMAALQISRKNLPPKSYPGKSDLRAKLDFSPETKEKGKKPAMNGLAELLKDAEKVVRVVANGKDSKVTDEHNDDDVSDASSPKIVSEKRTPTKNPDASADEKEVAESAALLSNVSLKHVENKETVSDKVTIKSPETITPEKNTKVIEEEKCDEKSQENEDEAVQCKKDIVENIVTSAPSEDSKEKLTSKTKSHMEGIYIVNIIKDSSLPDGDDSLSVVSKVINDVEKKKAGSISEKLMGLKRKEQNNTGDSQHFNGKVVSPKRPRRSLQRSYSCKKRKPRSDQLPVISNVRSLAEGKSVHISRSKSVDCSEIKGHQKNLKRLPREDMVAIKRVSSDQNGNQTVLTSNLAKEIRKVKLKRKIDYNSVTVSSNVSASVKEAMDKLNSLEKLNKLNSVSVKPFARTENNNKNGDSSPKAYKNNSEVANGKSKYPKSSTPNKITSPICDEDVVVKEEPMDYEELSQTNQEKNHLLNSLQLKPNNSSSNNCDTSSKTSAKNSPPKVLKTSKTIIRKYKGPVDAKDEAINKDAVVTSTMKLTPVSRVALKPGMFTVVNKSPKPTSATKSDGKSLQNKTSIKVCGGNITINGQGTVNEPLIYPLNKSGQPDLTKNNSMVYIPVQNEHGIFTGAAEAAGNRPGKLNSQVTILNHSLASKSTISSLVTSGISQLVHHNGMTDGHSSADEYTVDCPAPPQGSDLPAETPAQPDLQATSTEVLADSSIRQLPILQSRPGTFATPLDGGPPEQMSLPSSAGPLHKILNDNAYKMSEYFRHVMLETMTSLGQHSSLPDMSVRTLQLQLERLKWQQQQKIAELKHNTDLIIAEMRANLEGEKARAINEVLHQAELERVTAIAETKKKQWCAYCGRESQFFCCWNTSYCDYPCQQSHWTAHMLHCSQPAHSLAQTSSSNMIISTPAPLSKQSIGKASSTFTATDAALSKLTSSVTTTSVIGSAGTMPSPSSTYKLVSQPSVSSPQQYLINSMSNSTDSRSSSTAGGYIIVGGQSKQIFVPSNISKN